MVPAATAQSWAVGPPSRPFPNSSTPVPGLLGGTGAQVDHHLVHAHPPGDADGAAAHPHGAAGLGSCVAPDARPGTPSA